MTAHVAQIWRHPIKAHGFEALERTEIKAGETMPWDRAWAVTHEATKVNGGNWAHCANFSRGAKAPHLMAISSTLDAAAASLTLSHPDQPDLTFRPDNSEDLAKFIAWISPLMPKDRAASTGLVRATQQGMTDTPFPSISLGNLATLRVLEQRAGQPLDTRRFRINLWVEGLAPFEEFEWQNQTIRVGDVLFKAADRITRCSSTMANPETGRRDADPVAVMDAHWGHHDFGIALLAAANGEVVLNAPIGPAS